MEDSQAILFQGKLVDFALAELVRQHRDSFQPLWTVDSWAKLLIWMALNCGLSGDRESLELFAEALGPKLTGRLRRLFYERTLEDLELQLMADPAEPQVLVMPMAPGVSVAHQQAFDALDQVGLLERVDLDRSNWQSLDAVVVIPWKASELCG
ncbi:MAG: protein phosphatase [Prochlorococcaceae cyanobacterium ETNP7_MAG_30]|nr:protein phosphatase [Prochlorococcaceae cyanobacterium ETNP7_MAG_30]